MSCEACEDIWETDGAEPDCETARGCRIPRLSARESRILRMRETLIKLDGLVEPATVFGMYGASIDDVELLASVEEEMKKQKEEDG